MGRRQCGQGTSHAVAGEPDLLLGSSGLDDPVDPVGDLGKGLQEAGVDFAPDLAGRGQELAMIQRSFWFSRITSEVSSKLWT